MTLASISTYHEDLRAAHRAVLIALLGTGAPGVVMPALDQIEWEDEIFTNTLGTPWIRERQVQISSVFPSKGVQEHQTICALTLFYPAGTGTKIMGLAAGAIMAAFPFGMALAYGNTSALCTKVERKQGAVEPDWASIPVMITTTGHTYSD